MGLIVTLFLILINTYANVDAPKIRGFSYIEFWYVGVQIPVIFAFMEYGLILCVIKKYDMAMRVKSGKYSVGEIVSRVDEASFILSLLYFIILNIVYVWIIKKYSHLHI